MPVTELIAIAALLLNVGIAVVGSTWGVSWAIAKIRVTVADEMSRHRSDVDLRVDAAERNVGETVSAIKSKIHTFELWARDNLEAKGEAEKTLARYERLLGGALADITRRLDRIESKVDRQQAQS